MNKGTLLTFTFLLILTTSVFSRQSVDSQWKYPDHPELPFQLEDVRLDLTLEPDMPLIKGTGTYRIVSRQPGLTQIVFQTSDLDVKGVSSKDTEMEFRISKDSLIIQLTDTLNRRDQFAFMITWESSSPYGIHTDVYQNMWTSLNPKALRHWLPVPDHPELTSPVHASVTLPAERELVMNGQLAEDEVVSTDTKTVQWTTEQAIPLTGLTLATGPFRKLSARSGIKEVAIFAAEEALLEEVQSGLLSIAVESLKAYESKLSYEYPYESLNIVVLPDAGWDEKQSGAGVLYLYQNLGSLTTQLRRGIAAQWFGGYHRYLDNLDHRIEFLRLMVTGTSETDRLKNPNSLRSIEHWNFWTQGYELMTQDFMKEIMKASLPELLQELEGVIHWDEYAGIWYDMSGSYWDELPAPQGRSNRSNAADHLYEVEYQYDEANSVLILNFRAVGEPLETLAGLELSEFTFTDTTQTELSFTGESDTVTLNVDPSVDYVTLRPAPESEVRLTEIKPFMFLIRQLRSADKELRLEAIYGLQRYTDNPDLQLALQDVLKDETDAEVKAALSQTLSQITKGASGTEETFLENVRSEDLGLRLAGLKALASYPDDEGVRSAVRGILLRTKLDTVFNTALTTYKKLAGNDELLSLAERLSKEEQKDLEVLEVLSAAAQSDTSDQAVMMISGFLSASYPFDVRKLALDLMIEYEEDPNVWEQYLSSLMNDRDPRIRYHALDAIKRVSAKNTVELLVDRIREEMDPRVRSRLQKMMSDVNR